MLRILFCSVLLSRVVLAGDVLAVTLAGAVEEENLAKVEKLLSEQVDPNTKAAGRDSLHPLFIAVRAGNVPIALALIKAGADPSAKDGNGTPVIAYALREDGMAVARLLLEHGASLDVEDISGSTALVQAVLYKNMENLRMLADLGADMNLADSNGKTALMIAADQNNLAAAEILLKAKADPNLRDKRGDTALLRLLKSYQLGEGQENATTLLRLLIKSGADLNLRDLDGNSALLAALKYPYLTPEKLQIVLNAKPDVRIRDNQGRDALFHMITVGETGPFVESLLKLGADIRTTDNDGTNLLMLAAANRDAESVESFIHSGLDPTAKTKSGTTAVLAALRHTRPTDVTPPTEAAAENIVRILKLLHAKGCSLTDADSSGNTPLHLAAATELVSVVNYLMPFYPDLMITNGAGETLLHTSACAGTEEMLRLFLPKFPDIDIRDSAGNSPFSSAVADNNLRNASVLLKSGSDIDAADKGGATALSSAIGLHQQERFKFLLENKADVRKISNSGSLLLGEARRFHDHPASTRDDSSMILLLISSTRDIDARDSEGMTPLMWIAASNNVDTLDAILKRRPDLQARSPDGRTALMWAATSLAEASMAKLRAAGADDTLRDMTGRSADDWFAWSSTPLNTSIPPVREGMIPLREMLDQGWRNDLKQYLAKGSWNKSDRIAGTSPLHLAAALGDTAAISAILDLGASPDLRISDDTTPLMEATSTGMLDAVKLLLERGADASLRDTNNQRAIDQAVDLDHFEIARLLLHRKVSLSSDESGLLVTLIQKGDKELLREFLDAGASIPPPDQRTVDVFDNLGRSTTSRDPLVSAAILSDTAILKILMEFPAATGADSREILTTAMYNAAGAGSLPNVTLLVEEKGVDPSTSDGDTPTGMPEIDEPIRGTTGREQNEKFSALSTSLENGHEDVVRYLVGKKAEIAGRTRAGYPPLTFTIVRRLPEMLRHFLQNGASTALLDLDGKTALHLAAEKGNVDAVRLLLEHGADPAIKTPTQLTALDIASKLGHEEIINLLKNHIK